MDNIPKDNYVKNIPALINTKKLEFNVPVTFFAGENGSGKSTLLEAIAVSMGFNKEGGTKNYSFNTYEYDNELYKAINLEKGYIKEKYGYFYRAESFYNVATKEEEYADGNHPSKKYHERSHGEGFIRLIENSLFKNSLYLFDEPEAALSPQRQLSLISKIVNCAATGSQFIIVTHSPILLGIPNAEIFSFDNGKIEKTNYEETSSYIITKMFVNNRERILKDLLD